MRDKLEKTSNNVDFETVECPACKGSGRCMQCHGEGRISLHMAEEIEKRVAEEREKIRNEGWSAGLTQGQREITARNETIQSLQDSKANLERKLLSLENDITRLNE